jgi:hypothetical protein
MRVREVVGDRLIDPELHAGTIECRYCSVAMAISAFKLYNWQVILRCGKHEAVAVEDDATTRGRSQIRDTVGSHLATGPHRYDGVVGPRSATMPKREGSSFKLCSSSTIPASKVKIRRVKDGSESDRPCR